MLTCNYERTCTFTLRDISIEVRQENSIFYEEYTKFT